MIGTALRRLVGKTKSWTLRHLPFARTRHEPAARNWLGVYESFADVPVVGAGLTDEAWAADPNDIPRRSYRSAPEWTGYGP